MVFASGLRAAAEAEVKAPEAEGCMMRSYPHMCRDGHAEIGFAGNSGDCPMCERIAAVEAALLTIILADDTYRAECPSVEPDPLSAAIGEARKLFAERR